MDKRSKQRTAFRPWRRSDDPDWRERRWRWKTSGSPCLHLQPDGWGGWCSPRTWWYARDDMPLWAGHRVIEHESESTEHSRIRVALLQERSFILDSRHIIGNQDHLRAVTKEVIGCAPILSWNWPIRP